MNLTHRWATMTRSFALMLGMLCLGLATSAQAQDDPAIQMFTCAQINELGAGQKIPVGPSDLVTVAISTGGTATFLPVSFPLAAMPGDTVTITLSPGVSETSDPTLSPVATVAQWRLVTVDLTLLTQTSPITLPPITTVAPGGTLGSTLIYQATQAGSIGLLIAVDDLNGYATLTVGCTPRIPSAVPGVKVDLGSLAPQTGIFPTDSDTLTFTFDIAADDKVKSLLPGQSVTLPVTAVVDPALLADACGCIANTLTGEVTYALPAKTEPTPVPTLSEITLAVLGLLVAFVAVRSGAGRHGLKALAVLGLGAALLYPGHDLRAAGGNALESMNVSLSGTVVTVTVKRNPDCKVNNPPVMPPSTIKIDMANAPLSADETTRSYQLPAAADPEGDALTYSVTNLPTRWTFDAATRTVSWPVRQSCIVGDDGVPWTDSVANQVFDYLANDSCNKPVSVTVTCEPVPATTEG